jgi:hypothetical protein
MRHPNAHLPTLRRILVNSTALPYSHRTHDYYPAVLLVNDPKMNSDYSCHSFLYYYKIIEMISLNYAKLEHSLHPPQHKIKHQLTLLDIPVIDWAKAIDLTAPKLNAHAALFTSKIFDQCISNKLFLQYQLNKNMYDISEKVAKQLEEDEEYVCSVKLSKSNEDIRNEMKAFCDDLIDRRYVEIKARKDKKHYAHHIILLIGLFQNHRCEYEMHGPMD